MNEISRLVTQITQQLQKRLRHVETETAAVSSFARVIQNSCGKQVERASGSIVASVYAGVGCNPGTGDTGCPTLSRAVLVTRSASVFAVAGESTVRDVSRAIRSK